MKEFSDLFCRFKFFSKFGDLIKLEYWGRFGIYFFKILGIKWILEILKDWVNKKIIKISDI